MSHSYIPRQGLRRDPPDSRDFLYQDLFGAGEVSQPDWQTGFSLYDQLGIAPLAYDQGLSSSCVAQATASHLRAWHKQLTNEDIDFSRRFIYSQISAGLNAGASLRDGVQLVATIGDCPESTVASYEQGRPPSESFMYSQEWMSEAVFDEARRFDQFSYRVIPGQTTDIDLFAHAIRNNCGAVGGFTLTVQGWSLPLVRIPQAGEQRGSHAVFLSGFGMYEGKKCLFTKNSWGGRYTITEGRWRGYQAISEDYFLAAENTAVGPVLGAYVFNTWVLVPDRELTPNLRLMDFLRRNEGKLVQDSQQSGAIGVVVGGKIMVARPERLAQLIATYLVRKEGVGVPRDLWNAAPKQDV
jgi:hypothetical protein